MIGKIKTGKSFRGCLLYCLHDKRPENKLEQVMENRAELVAFNQCFGTDKELIRQFNEVRALNPKLSRPVMHITLSLAHGESLSNAILHDLAEDCARQMGFENNQYVAILHKDRDHQHLHIVANRIGFDGKTVSDSNSYKKIAEYCRKMELKYKLKQVLSPARYLSKELRNIPRYDQRKEMLRGHILETALRSADYSSFEQQMRKLGYEIYKGRGIAFKDKEKVYTKGSEVGFPLKKLEKILALQPELKQQMLKRLPELKLAQEQLKKRERKQVDANALHSEEKKHSSSPVGKVQEHSLKVTIQFNPMIEKMMEILFKDEHIYEPIIPELTEEEERKRKQRQRQQRERSRHL